MYDSCERNCEVNTVHGGLRYTENRLRNSWGRVEAFAAGLAVDHVTEHQESQLKKLVLEIEKLDPETDLEKPLQKNREFHYIIYSAAGNETLVEMIEQLWKHIQRLRSFYLCHRTDTGIRRPSTA